MPAPSNNSGIHSAKDAMVRAEANPLATLRGFSEMARRRFQDPTPKRRGAWWVIRYRQDDFVDGQHKRVQREVRLAPVTIGEREARRIAAEHLRPLNQGLDSVVTVGFQSFATKTYLPIMRRLLAASTYDRYSGVIDHYLLPRFGNMMLRELTPIVLQTYLAGLSDTKLSHESIDKIRDVLSAVLREAVKYQLLVRNPMEGLQLPAERRGRRRSKPYLTPEQFELLIAKMPEPYASMVYVAIFTGLRVSELVGLRWNDIHADSITIDERFCRGDWGAPKSEASNATIAVNRCVIERIHRLKLLTVEVKGGGPGNKAVRKYRVVKCDGPEDLVFQSVRDGKPARDNNTLSRFIKPAARGIGLPWVNWRSLRTSHATWLKMAGADVKDAQGQMRHSRASTTLDIYQQFVVESQQRVVERLNTLTTRRVM
jgi:integrase